MLLQRRPLLHVPTNSLASSSNRTAAAPQSYQDNQELRLPQEARERRPRQATKTPNRNLPSRAAPDLSFFAQMLPSVSVLLVVLELYGGLSFSFQAPEPTLRWSGLGLLNGALASAGARLAGSSRRSVTGRIWAKCRVKGRIEDHGSKMKRLERRFIHGPVALTAAGRPILLT